MAEVIDVVELPRDLTPRHTDGRAVAVFDVLRATTTMAAALSTGVAEVRLFDSPDSARAAAECFTGPRLLAGEVNCLPPTGFDTGNSPASLLNPQWAGRTMFMATTNGTKALLAAGGVKAGPGPSAVDGSNPPRLVTPAALVNRSAAAWALARAGGSITLLCAGTQGEPAMEDLIGCGAVIDRLLMLSSQYTLASDRARVALSLFRASAANLAAALRDTTGGRNVLAAGLADDIAFCAALDRFNVAGKVHYERALTRVVKA